MNFIQIIEESRSVEKATKRRPCAAFPGIAMHNDYVVYILSEE